jgi:hypothetical protein
MAGCISERVLTDFMQRLSPLVNEGSKSALVRTISDEAFIVFQFDIVCFYVDSGEPRSSVRSERSVQAGFFSQERLLCSCKPSTNGHQPLEFRKTTDLPLSKHFLAGAFPGLPQFTTPDP